MDLSSNNISGAIPWHLSNLTGMTLKGKLPLELCPYRSGNEVGYTSGKNQFKDIMLIIIKGQQLKYDNGLEYFVSIDLSGNSLTGETSQQSLPSMP